MFKTKLEVDRHVDNSLRKINNETEKNLRCFSFAKLYFNVGSFEQATRYCSMYLSVKPKSAEGHQLLGKALEKLGKKEAALEAYRKSLQQDPKQNKLIIKVCELLASDDVDMDKEGAKYYCDLAQSIDPHNSIVYTLKERLLTSENDNPADVSKLLLNELESRPTDIGLRVRLLKHFLQHNKIKEAYKHASDIENKQLGLFHNSTTWYETFAEVLVRYQREMETSLTWDFWFLSVAVLERLVALSLDDHQDNLKASSEYLTFLFNFDQILTKASENIAGCPDRQLGLVFLNHFHAQLYFHIATCLFKQAKKDFLQFKEASNISLPVLFAAYHSQPPDLQSMWLTNCPENRRKLVHRWHKQAAFRCSQTGHILLAAMKDRKSIILEKAAQYSTGIWREQLYKKLFVKRDQQQKMVKSFFVSSPNLLEPVLKIPDTMELLQFDEVAQLVHPDSLHNFIWIAMNTGNLAQFVLKSFEGLTYSVKNLNNCAAESLNILDIQSFIYCATLCAQAKLEDNQHHIYYHSDKPSVLPAPISEDLGTVNQSKFLTAAYKMYKNDQSFNTGDVRLLLIKGIEVVRCIGQHGLDVKLLVKLANIFDERSKKSSKQSEIDFNDARADLYWKAALPILDKLKHNQAVTQPQNRMFEYRAKEMNMYEVCHCIEKGKLFTAVQLMKRKDYEKALHIFELLKDPYASYHQAEIYKHMADQKTNQNRENITAEMRSQNVILLSKARDCLYLTLDRLREPSVDKSHPLNAQLGSEIEKIERLLSRIDPDCTNRNECDGMSDENVSSDSVGDHYHSTYNTTHLTSFTPKHEVHSTPYKLDLTRREARPSPERLDAQLRQLAASKDVALNHIVEQNKIIVESHKSLLEELRSFKDAVNNLTATVEDLKTMRHGLEEIKEVKNSVKELKNSVDDLQNMVDVIKEMKKEIGDLKKDSNKPAQLSEEDLYVLDPDYDYNLGQFNSNLYNYQGRMPASAGIPTASYGPPATMYPGLYPAMAAAYPYGVLPAPGLPFVPEQQLSAYPSHPVQPNPQVASTSLGIGLLSGQGLTQNMPPVIKDITKASLSTFTSTTQAVFPSMSPVTTKPAPSNLPTSKAAPVNVVITSSDPLPLNMTPVSQPPLSVVIPPQHIKGNVQKLPTSQPHNYQIPLPASGITSITTTPSILNQPAPVISTHGILSNVSAPTYSAITPSKSPSKNVSLGLQIEQTLDKTFSPNNTLNKSNVSVDEHDPCPDFKPIIPLPDEVPVNTGEENELVLFAEKAKLFRYVDKEWKERGVGQLKLLEDKDTGKIRLLMRREQVHKICANHLISDDIHLSQMPNNDRAYCWVAQDFAEGEIKAEKFCVRFKTADEAGRFQQAVEDAKKKVAKLPATPKPKTAPADSSPLIAQPPSNSLGGFTFTSTPTFKPKETEAVTPTVATSTNSQAAVKPSPFSNFTFGSKTTTSSSLFGTPSATGLFSFASPSTTAANTSNVTPAKSTTITPAGTGLFSFASPALSTTSTITPSKTTLTPAQTTPASKNDADDHHDDFVPTAEFKPVINLPDLVDVVTGEENAEVLFESKTKLLKLVTVDNKKEWKERGLGIIKILKEDRIRLVMRREQVHKVCLNHQVLKDMQFKLNATNPKAVMWSAKDFSEGVLTPETFTALFKTVEQAADFLKTLQTSQASLNEQNVLSSKQPVKGAEAPQTGFGDQFKPVKGSWSCKNCYIVNEAKSSNCIVCETKNDAVPDKVEDSGKPGPVFSFGTPTEKPKGFGDAFKPKANSWECKACFVSNDGSTSTCVACQTSKDGTAAKKEPVGISLETNQKFSFGIQPASTNKPCVPEVTQKSGFGDLFKPKANSWECKGCFVRNEGADLYCKACEAPQNDSVPKKEATKGVNLDTGGLKFSFGIPAAPVTSTTSPFAITKSQTQFSFGTTTTASLFGQSTTSTFSFSPATPVTSVQESQPNPISKFTFAPTTVTPKTEEKKEDSFVFGSTAEHKFEFTPRSPGRRISSGQGDEDSDASYVEEEEDNTYFKPVIPLPDKVDVKTGEEDETVLYCQRAKLFRFVNSEWKERGIGDVKILSNKVNGKFRVLMRREQVMKICLNHILTKDIDYRAKDDKTWLFHAADYSEGEISRDQFCLRFKSLDIAKEFKKAIDEALAGGAAAVKAPTEPESENDVIILDEPINEADLKEAKRLQLPYTFFQNKDKPDCNCAQCLKDDEYLKGTEFSTKKADEKPSIFGGFSTSGTFSFGSTPTTVPKTTAGGLFGTPSTGAAEGTPSFGFTPTSAPKANDSSLKSLLATPSVLGKPATTSSLFGTPAAGSAETTPSIFGKPATIGSVFGTPTTSANEATPSLFGKPATTGGLFGTPTTSANEATPITFGKPATTGSFFGTPTTSANEATPSVFGKPATIGSVFGTPTTSTNETTPSIFGKPATTGGLFGTPTTNTEATPFGAAPAFGTKPLFGGTPNSNTTFGAVSATPIFGASSSTVFSPKANATPTSFSGSLFGSAPATGNTPKTASSIFGGSSGLFGSVSTTASSGNLFQQAAPVNLSQKPVTTKLKDTDEVVLTSKTNISFASLAANTASDAAPAFAKTDSTQPFSFLGSGAPVFGATTMKKIDKNKSLNASQAEDDPQGEEEAQGAAEEEYDPHYEPIIAMPDEIVVSTGEENEDIVFNERSKLYRYDNDTKEWKERGVGQMKVLFHPERKTYRLILRRDQVHKVVLNQLVQSDMDLQPMATSDKSWTWIGHNYTDDGHQVETLALRFKTVELAQKFKECIDTTICRVIEYTNQKLSQIPTSVSNYEAEKQENDDEDYGQGEEEEEYEDDEDIDEEEDEEDDDDDDDDNLRSALFESLPGEVQFSFSSNGVWQNVGSCMVAIYYDNDLCTTRTNIVRDDGECVSSTIIGTNTLVEINDRECVWDAVERVNESRPTKRKLKIVFKSSKSANNFHSAYLNAVSYAQEVGIQDEEEID